MSNTKLSNEEVLGQLKQHFNDAIVNADLSADMLTVEIAPNQNLEIIKYLKEDAKLDISFLTILGGVHYPDDKDRELAVVYHLHSLPNYFRIRLKAFLPISNPEINSIVELYAGANWMERETFDFYGIQFKNHPNLVRILNEDTMDYFPLRKEYHLEDATREDKDDRFFGR